VLLLAEPLKIVPAAIMDAMKDKSAPYLLVVSRWARSYV